MRGGYWISVAMGALALCGCKAEAGPSATAKPESVKAAPAEAAPPKAEAKAVAVPPATNAPSSVEVKRDYFNFTYSWPKAMAAFPLLQDYFQSDANQMLTELEGYFDEDDRMKDPKEEYKPTYESELAWTVAAQTDGMVSLSGAWFSYTGGAHGMHGVRAMAYHKGSDAILQANEVIGDTDAFVGAIEEEFCRLLDTERAKRRNEPVNRDEMFGECIKLLDQTIIWESNGGGKFDRMEVFIGPYEAGPYAEGAYVLNLPITAPMMAAIVPQYRGNFAVSGGKPYSVEDQ